MNKFENKVEEQNLDLQKRIKDLEFELEKQQEYNKTLIQKQKDYNEEMAKNLKGENVNVNENCKDSTPKSPDTKRELYDENIISMSFNQALIKYESGQSLHSPYFEEWDEKIDIIQEVFSRWAINIESVINTGHENSRTLSNLQKIFMEDLTSFDFSTEIVNDLYSFADMLKEFASMQDALYESVRSSLLEYIREFNKNFVMKVKENKKVYNKHFDEYYNIVSKIIHAKKGSNIEELNNKIDDHKRDLELIRMQYVDSLNEIIIHTKVDLIDKV